MNFDKVFAVPQVPGAVAANTPPATTTVPSSNVTNYYNDNNIHAQNKSTESSDSSIDEQKDSDEKEGNLLLSLFRFAGFGKNFVFVDAVVYRNGNNGHAMHKSDSLEEDLQRAISTAERRKVS